MPEINVAIIGYKFMGSAHSNAYRQVSHFFPGKFTPRLKVICGRDREADGGGGPAAGLGGSREPTGGRWWSGRTSM